MHYDDMEQIEERMFEQIRKIRETKGLEYASREDRLADFKEVAREAGCSPLQVWLVYVEKHLRAIRTFVREGSVKSERIEDRVLDVIVYHLLLVGLVADIRNDNRVTEYSVRVDGSAVELPADVGQS